MRSRRHRRARGHDRRARPGPSGCTVALERRTLPGEQIDDVEQEITDLLDACRRLDPALEAAARTLLVRDPFEIAETVPFVGLVRDAAVEVLERAEERDA